MVSSNSIAEVNKKKYVYPPSYDKIAEFIKELGVSNHHFEKFYGIPYNIIAQIKLGTKRLPPQYWHFVFEKIVPTIGPGYIKMLEKQSIPKTITKTITRNTPTYTKEANVASLPDTDSHDRTGNLK